MIAATCLQQTAENQSKREKRIKLKTEIFLKMISMDDLGEISETAAMFIHFESVE